MELWAQFLLIFIAIVFMTILAYRISSATTRTVGDAILMVGSADKVKNLQQNPRTKSEQHVIDLFEKHTGEKFPTVYPDWLIYRGKRLELDGYCEKLRVAVEFSGPLHTKWYPNKEPYAKYLDRIKRDEAKIKICRDRNVRLFVIDMRIPKHQLSTYIRSRLYDVGLISSVPGYIPEQLYAPDIDYAHNEK